MFRCAKSHDRVDNRAGRRTDGWFLTRSCTHNRSDEHAHRADQQVNRNPNASARPTHNTDGRANYDADTGDGVGFVP